MDQSTAARAAVESSAPEEIPAKWGYAISTYRYLRLSIVIVTGALAASLIEQAWKTGCVQGSISAFYYTPVHSMFITALGVIGVALFSIRGSDWLREALLNMAGLLAPVVALLPTSRPTPPSGGKRACPINDAIGTIPGVFRDNNLRALIIGGLASALFVLVAARQRKKTSTSLRNLARRETRYPAIGAVAVLVALWIWRKGWPHGFSVHAHSYSAIVMFIFAAFFVVLTAMDAKKANKRTLHAVYSGCAALMGVGFGAAIAVGLHWKTWGYTVLMVEIIEATAFVAFWATQTVELWGSGIELKVDKEAEVSSLTPPGEAAPAPAG